MVSASFQQVSFLGGEWSENAQGRITDPGYKRALASSYNGMPTETGAWTRRPGFRFLGITRHGAPAKLFSFDYSTIQPYQIELTDGYLRLWAGLAPVVADDDNGYAVLGVSTASPAVVQTGGIPGTWADGDTVFFDINTTPCSCPALCGRQFTIQNVTASTFSLYDPITNLPIDGSTLGWTVPTDYTDVVKKVFELVTPYVNGQWKDVRIINNGTQVTLFHPLYKPKSLTLATNEPFALADQAFADGPYLDLNTTSTTLTPSALTGTITMTASSVAGINGGVGFLATDVGRHLRFQSAPPAWSGSTPYAKAAQVTGSDSNVYSAVASSTGVDPTSDNGTHWIISATTATWVWMIITAWVSNTSVTCSIQGTDDLSQQSPTILGDTLASLSPQSVWMLGSFSDTTGWPSMGCYHNSRLWLANTLAPNRYDAGVDGDFFNFCPTAIDGSISDANGFTDEILSEQVDAVFWMLSTGEGLMVGTQGSEHRIRASVLDDPLSFTNQQERRVSAFGSKNVEPVLPWGRPVFVQRQNRKLLSLRPVAEARYDGDNVTVFSGQIASRGIEEVRWQQEPALTLWMRLSDGGLAGIVYRFSDYRFGFEMADLNYQAAFPVYHAYGRTFSSISTGPSYDGTSNALYAVTNQTDETAADFGVYHVEYMMPMFTEATADWGAYFVDGGGSPCCGREFLVSNGDSFNGVRIYGLTYLNGLSVSIVIGGLYIGDFAVANGFVDVPFGTPATFTQAFFEDLGDGTEYGAFAGDFSFVQTSVGPTPTPDCVGMWDDNAQTQYHSTIIDPNTNRVFKVGLTGGLVEYDFTTFGILRTLSAAGMNVSPWSQSGGVCIFNRYFVGNSTAQNHSQKFRINIDTGGRVNYGTDSSSLDPSGTDPADNYAMCTSTQIIGMQGGSRNYTAHVSIGSGGLANEIALMDLDTFQLIKPTVQRITEDVASICAGPSSGGVSFTSFFILGSYNYPVAMNYTLGIYWALNSNGTLVLDKVADFGPTQIDATWSTFSQVSKPYWIPKNNTVLFHITTLDSVTHKSYLCCFDPTNLVMKWKLPLTAATLLDPAIYGSPLHNFIWFSTGTSTPVWDKLDISTGAVLATHTFSPPVISGSFGFASDGSIVTQNLTSAWSTPGPTFLGTYAQAHGLSPARTMPAKMSLDATDTSATRVYSVPSSIGLAYASKGQLLPPDAGYDAGARNGPAFGKKRRLHWYAAKVTRTRDLKFGTDFAGKMRPMTIASSGGVIVPAPGLISDVVTTTIDDDYSFKGQIAWEITTPYPATITTIGGYIEGVDK